ncbi:MAG: hypothetical protein V4697_03735 [Patescibacteria group bacterium]
MNLYTLLPDKEISALKREYRTRLFIVFLFFVSCGIFLGILSLVPAYILSYTQEEAALLEVQKFEKGRQDRGTDVVLAELASTTAVINRIKAHEDQTLFSNILTRVLIHKPSRVSLISFYMTKAPAPEGGVSPGTNVVVQGSALTRDSLVDFKKRLEGDVSISNIELPLSDLAKSKDIVFSVRFIIQN